MTVMLAQPRGLCAGVVRAIDIVERALRTLGDVEAVATKGHRQRAVFPLPVVPEVTS